MKTGSIVDYLLDKKKVLWIGMYSMRRYDNGKYQLLKDGNLMATLSKILSFQKKTNGIITLVIPAPNQCDDYNNFIDYVTKIGLDTKKIKFLNIGYPENAYNIRLKMNLSQIEEKININNFDAIVSEIPTLALPLRNALKFYVPLYSILNISYDKSYPRNFLDKFRFKDLEAFENSDKVFVLNERQRIFFDSFFGKDKIILDQKLIHPNICGVFKGRASTKRKLIFFPFRVSDDSYKFLLFKEVIEKLYEKDKDFTILFTDPNLSLEKKLIDDMPNCVVKFLTTKEEYMDLLWSRPVILYLEDIDYVLHPGLLEFLYCGCRLIYKKNKYVEDSEGSVKDFVVDEIVEKILFLFKRNKISFSMKRLQL